MFGEEVHSKSAIYFGSLESWMGSSLRKEWVIMGVSFFTSPSSLESRLESIIEKDISYDKNYYYDY